MARAQLLIPATLLMEDEFQRSTFTFHVNVAGPYKKISSQKNEPRK